jgi:vaccinia related kinase
MLGYNMLQWLCGKLPWEDANDPEYMNFKKDKFMSDIFLLMLRCFLDSEPPAVLSQYLEYVASLGFETTPNYTYCRKLLRQGIEDCGCVDDGKLVFADSPIAAVTENTNRGSKRTATEDPENIAEMKPKKRICNTARQPCVSNRTTRNSPASLVLPSHQEFSWKEIIPLKPEKQVKKQATSTRKLPTNIPANSQQVVPMQRLSNFVTQKFAESSLVSEPTKPWQQTADTSSFSNPTPAMLDIMSKKRQKASTAATRRDGMCRARTPVQPPREEQVMMPGEHWWPKQTKERAPTRGQRSSRRAALRKNPLEDSSWRPGQGPAGI